MWYNTEATKILGIDYPIMQGPFGGGLSSVELVATVSNKGGLGGYGAYTLSPEEIIEVNNKIKAATNKPYNINLWVSDSDAQNGTVTDEQYEQAAQLFRPYFDETGIALPGKPAPFKSRFENQVQVKYSALCSVYRLLMYWNNAVSWVLKLSVQLQLWTRLLLWKPPVSI